MEVFDMFFLSVFAVLVGFFSSQLAKALDSAFDYGHWLDWFRLYKVRTAARKVGMSETFEKGLKQNLMIGDFGERLSEIDQLYWRIASKYKPLTLWLCPFCLSHRINFFISISLMVAFCLENQKFFPEILGFYLISFSINQIFITR